MCALAAARSGLFIQSVDRPVRTAWNSLVKGAFVIYCQDCQEGFVLALLCLSVCDKDYSKK